MLKSMTGFGKSECQLPSKKLTIEIRSLNSKQVDTSTRLPAVYKEKELEIRQLLAKSLERGKIECSLHYEILEGSASTINKSVVSDYLEQMKELTEGYNVQPSELLSTIMRLPDTVTSVRPEFDENEWAQVLESVIAAVSELDSFRIQEGTALETDLTNSIASIRAKLIKIEPFENERLNRVRERIQSGLNDLQLNEDIDKNRFEQELIFYMEKLDINEEKVRLANHLDYFIEILESGSPNGKKLGFISQEIGREINTLGSKANHAEIQKIVVDMKDDLEKIKEQVLNVL